MRFLKYLNEFVVGKDSDYPSNDKRVIIWNKKDSYTLKGKTHGLLSHSIKHLKDFNPSFFNNILAKLSNYIKTTDFFILLNNSVKKEEFSKIPDEIMINTLDRINDKIMLKEPLTSEETEINEKFNNPLKSRYSEVFDKIVNNAIDTDKLSLPEILKSIKEKKTLKVVTTENKIYYVNFIELFMGIVKKGKGRTTLFKISSDKAKSKEYILRNIEKDTPVNKELLKLKDLTF
jgi:hypothetical protein